jgi:hypothetical protein
VERGFVGLGKKDLGKEKPPSYSPKSLKHEEKKREWG